MSLLTALIVKNSHVLAGIYFIFLENATVETWKSFNTKFGPPWKDRERSYQERQTLALFFFFALKLPELSNRSNLEGSGAS